VGCRVQGLACRVSGLVVRVAALEDRLEWLDSIPNVFRMYVWMDV
jgi:hypothetical protein